MTKKTLCILAILLASGCSDSTTNHDLDSTSSAISMRNFGKEGGAPWSTTKTIVMTDDREAPVRYGNVVAAGDINKDGKVDIVSAMTGSDGAGYVDINWGSSHYQFRMNPDTKPSDDQFGTAIEVGNFCSNLGSKGDIVIASAPNYGRSQGGFGLIYYRSSTIRTQRRLVYPDNNTHAGTAFTVGDINGDGKPDLIFQAKPESEQAFIGVQLDLCESNGNMNVSTSVKGSSAESILGSSLVVANLNGAPELAAIDAGLNRVYFYTFRDNQLVESRPYFQSETTPTSLEFADLDGDGQLDMILGQPEYSGEHQHQGRIIVVKNAGKGAAFDPADVKWAAYGVEDNSHLGQSIKLADVNADGSMDLIAGAPGTDDAAGRVSVYMGTIDGSLLSAPYWQSTPKANGFGTAVDAANLNNQGWLDLIVGSPKEDGHIVTFLQTEAPCYQSSGCLVDEVCYKAGDTLGNACEICDPKQNNFGASALVCEGQSDDPCSTGSVCDPERGCVPGKMKPNGTACGPTACISSSAMTAFVCQSGVCTEKTVSCGNYLCNEDKDACYKSCTNDEICADGYLCRATLNMCIGASYNHPPISDAVLSDGYMTTNYELHKSVNDPLYFDASASYDPDFDPMTYKWACYVNQLQSPYAIPGDLIFESTEMKGSTNAFNKVGNYLCELIVSDGHSESEPKTINFVVYDENNDAPYAVAIARDDYSESDTRLITTLGSTVTLDASESFDPEGDKMTYEWRVSKYTSAVSEHYEEWFNGEFVDWVPPMLGDYKIWLKAIDEIGNIGNVEMEVQVKAPGNEPPVVVATVQHGASKGSTIFVRPGDMITFDASQSYDPEGGPLKFHWTGWGFDTDEPVVVAPAMNRAEGESVVFVYTIVVTDDVGNETRGEVRVGIVPNPPENNPPVIVLPEAYKGQPGQTIALNASDSYDPDGDFLYFRWTGDDIDLLTSDSIDVPQFTIPEDADYGTTYSFTLTLLDGNGGEATQTTFVIVADPTDPEYPDIPDPDNPDPDNPDPDNPDPDNPDPDNPDPDNPDPDNPDPDNPDPDNPDPDNPDPDNPDPDNPDPDNPDPDNPDPDNPDPDNPDPDNPDPDNPDPDNPDPDNPDPDNPDPDNPDPDNPDPDNPDPDNPDPDNPDPDNPDPDNPDPDNPDPDNPDPDNPDPDNPDPDNPDPDNPDPDNPDEPKPPILDPDQPPVNPDDPDHPIVNPDDPDHPPVNPDDPDQPPVNPDDPTDPDYPWPDPPEDDDDDVHIGDVRGGACSIAASQTGNLGWLFAMIPGLLPLIRRRRKS